eukprot:scaffold1726_cov260-Pinguiococcus_pyrenoidosus.AAC.25
MGQMLDAKRQMPDAKCQMPNANRQCLFFLLFSRGMLLPKEAEYLATTGPYSLVHRCMQTGSWARNLLADHCWQA